MLRNPWFWISIILILIGIALTAALGVFYWLAGALLASILILVVVFLVAAYAVKRTTPPQVPRLEKVAYSQRIPVIYDCDVTMGYPFRDVGDGLTLLYLLGEPRVHLRLVTTTYGNGPVKMTTRATRRLLTALGQDDVSVVPGAASPDKAADTNQAARHLRDLVSAQPGEITLIATGSMTNLKHAADLDPDFFTKLRGLYLLGGITNPLIWNGHQLAERNFSLDPDAACLILNANCPITIATGHVGLTAVFRSPQFAALNALGDPVSRLIVRKIRCWFALTRLWFQDDGFGMWDSPAALALTHPELFELERVQVTAIYDELKTGKLSVTPARYGSTQLLLRVRDFDGFIMAHFAAWQHLWRRIDTKTKRRKSK